MRLIKQHFNKPQLRSLYIAAPFELDVMGRGLGKTTKILAPKSAQCYFKELPRSTGTNINATFTQAYTRTLKELIRGWQDIGYIMDVHFIVGKRPSEKWIKKWNWKGPFAYPMDFKHVICWFNGAVMQLISQDRPGSTNGMSVDWGIADEIKLLNYERLAAEWFPANRGIVPEFVGNPYHHGYTFTTDMPIGNNGRWIFELAEKMDKQKINDLWELISVEFQLKEYIKNTKGAIKQKLIKQLEFIQQDIRESRKGLFYYQEASTLENIHTLGIEYIKQQLRDTSSFLFDVQILNLKPLRLEDGFYPDFEEEYHGYFSEHAEYFDNSEIDYNTPVLDCRKDKDLNLYKPLHIALDYNRSIHPIVVGQENEDSNEFRLLNGLYELYPKKLKEAIKSFATYYKFHKHKVVFYWYDHTAVGEQHESRICDDVINELTKYGWVVVPMYLGNITYSCSHEFRFRMFGDIFKEDGKYEAVLRFNRENCSKLILSLQMAEVSKYENGFKKNKKTEHDGKTPAEESTHFSEALDVLCYGIFESKLKFSIKDSGSTSLLMM